MQSASILATLLLALLGARLALLLDGEEHGPELGEPFWLDGRDALHEPEQRDGRIIRWHSDAFDCNQEAIRRQSGGNQEAIRRQSGGTPEALCCTHDDQQMAIIIIISVLLGSHHELVVDYVLGLHAHPVECRRRVQVARHARAHVQVLRDRLHARGVLEVR